MLELARDQASAQVALERHERPERRLALRTVEAASRSTIVRLHGYSIGMRGLPG
jgi:hypothetical protein